MKRLNKRQQDFLNEKFRKICDAFFQQETKHIDQMRAKLKPISISGRIMVSANSWWGGSGISFEAVEKSIVLPANYARYMSARKDADKLNNRLKELKEEFAERIMFSSNDFEEVGAVMKIFEDRVK